ncbi:MAG: hypothetical protein OHK0012_14390 [Synechococcales cyanobacterium]
MLYRGLHYTAQTTPATRTLNAGFRGHSYTYQPAKVVNLHEVNYAFRGIPVRLVSVSSQSVKELVRDAMSVHQANIQRRLDQRLQSARQRGDEQLLHALESEQQQMA